MDELSERLRRHVFRLAGEIGERNIRRYDRLVEARRAIEGEFREIGLPVNLQEYHFSGLPFHNVEAVLRGATAVGWQIVLGAHYDTVPGSPGANDNASGVAVLLELARELSKEELPATLRFVAFPNEEPPFFNTEEGMGSVEYLRGFQGKVSEIEAMFSLETVGFYSDLPGSQRYPGPLGLLYPDRGNFLAFVGNLSSASLVRGAVKAFRRSTPLPAEGVSLPASVPGVSWSDHRSFWRAGVRAMMVTDTAPFRDPHYHLPTDTPDRLDYRRLAQVVTGLAGAIRSIASQDHP